MADRIAAWFDFSGNGTDYRTEILAGATTFMTMAYIIFLNPLILTGALTHQPTGMDGGAVMVATCLGAALGTLIMGLYGRYPLAQAPGMGENFFFVTMVGTLAAAGVANAWMMGLGVVFFSGVLFLALSLAGARSIIIRAISPDMKHAMAAGIGIFIAFIGLRNAGVIAIPFPGVIQMNHQFGRPDILVFLIGVILTAGLCARHVRGAILWGLLATAIIAGVAREAMLALCGAEALPAWLADSGLIKNFRLSGFPFSLDIPSLAPTFMAMDLRAAWSWTAVPFIIVFLFMDMFDTIGTFVGVTRRTGLMAEDGTMPRIEQALTSDAVATVTGAMMGTSTVTTFIESATGVEQGGRTGFTSVVTAGLFVLALFASPLVGMIGTYPSLTAPALVIVGAMMLRSAADIRWDDYSEAIPCFLCMLGIPLSYSIADGLALGFVSYPLVKVCAGKSREVGWLMYVLAVVLIAYFVGVRSAVG